MNIMNIMKIAFRNLNRQKRRSVLLALAVAFAFLIVTMIDGISTGAMKGLEYQFAKMTGGHVFVLGAEKAADKKEGDKAVTGLKSTELIDKVLNEIGVKPLYTTARDETGGTLLFEGKQTMTRLVGCKFDEEKLLKESISFVEGNWEMMKKENAILLSEGLVKEMKLCLHDTILFETTTSTGQAIVAEFQLEGIAKDKSALAQMSNYAHLKYINKIQQLPENNFSSYNLYLKDMRMQEVVANKLEAKLAEYAPVTNRKQAKINSANSPFQDIRKQLNNGKWKGTKYGVASMYDFAPQLTTLVEIVHYISLGVLVVLLAITMIGVSNTFRMIVHERRKEIGTMRACGVPQFSTKWLFITEAILLSIFGAMAGFVLAVIIMQIIAFIPIATNSWVNVFSINNRLKWILPPISILIKFLVMILLTLLAARGSAKKAAGMVPAHTLRS